LPSEVVRVFCLDVGQGDATVIVGPQQGAAIIVDARQPEPILNVLREHGISRIPVALLTHDDHDHIAGFAAVLREFLHGMQGTVDIVAYDADRLPMSGAFGRQLALLGMLCLPEGPLGPRTFQPCTPTTNDRFLSAMLRGTCVATILYPSKLEVDFLARSGLPRKGRRMRQRPRSRPNEASAILMLEWAGHRMLLGADLGALGWTILSREQGHSLRADVFRFPHHGGRFSRTKLQDQMISQAGLLETVSPSTVILSVGTGNSHGHPDPDTIRAICSRGNARLLCTEATGLCLCSGHQEPAAQHRGAVPCAGTVTVTLGPGSMPVVLPSEEAHNRIIDGFACPACSRRG